MPTQPSVHPMSGITVGSVRERPVYYGQQVNHSSASGRNTSTYSSMLIGSSSCLYSSGWKYLMYSVSRQPSSQARVFLIVLIVVPFEAVARIELAYSRFAGEAVYHSGILPLFMLDH
jgi:hypothetical protein